MGAVVVNITEPLELAPRFNEFRTRLEKLTGLKEKELVAALEAADKAVVEGKPYREPIPFHALLDAMNAAAEVTVPVGRQGDPELEGGGVIGAQHATHDVHCGEPITFSA